MSIVVRAVAVGLLIEGAGWVNTASPDLPWRADWCDCTDWSEAESRCFASRTVIEWPCGVPVHLRILLLPESELAPMRPEVTYSLPDWSPGDIDLDGFVTRRDPLKWAEWRYDFDLDGAVTLADDAAVLAWVANPCP